MKVVLDTNVVVSGLLSPFGAAGEIIRMAAAGILTLCYDARILAEYRNVLLRPKFHFEQVYLDRLFTQIETCGHLVAAEPLAKRLPDTDDEPFLEAALAGKAKCLVTGNSRHFPTNKRQGMLVVSPAEFIEIYRKKM